MLNAKFNHLTGFWMLNYLMDVPQGREGVWNHLMFEKPPSQLHQQVVMWPAGARHGHRWEDRGGGGEIQGDTHTHTQLVKMCLLLCPYNVFLSHSQVKKSTKKVRVTVKPHLLFRVSLFHQHVSLRGILLFWVKANVNLFPGDML